jgi:hypothetical protein
MSEAVVTQRLIGRRRFLTGAGAVAVLGALDGCRLVPGDSRTKALHLPRLHASVDESRGLRSAPALSAHRVRGSTWRRSARRRSSTTTDTAAAAGRSWGSGAIATSNAMATGERDIAVIGCGALD